MLGAGNQVQRDYYGLGQLITEYQAHSGAVNTGTTPKVLYTYSEMASSANHSRLTKMTYPDGRILRYEYSSGLDNSISRLSFLADDNSGSVGTHLEEYSYLGLGTVVKQAHPEPDTDLTYIKQGMESNGDAGDQYTGLDRFGRIVDQRWIDVSAATATDRFQYGYDRDSNRLWRDNLVNTDFGELYAYDNLNQITSFDRGELNSTKDGIEGTPSRTQDWDFDALGNFNSVTTDSSTQTRDHDAQNQITSMSGATTPTYDDNRNTTGDESGNTLIYDAWNRLVEVKDGMTTLVSYSHDALNRRVTEDAGTERVLYYSDQWQVLEERESGDAVIQYVWSPVYVDAMVLRDRDTDSNGTLDERLYVQQDVNFNVTALVSTVGVVIERNVYDPFGVVTILAPDWSARGASSYEWVYQHQGGRLEVTTGLYHFRMREYSPTVGRWIREDPTGFAAGDSNLDRVVGNNPLTFTDSTGLWRLGINGHISLRPFLGAPIDFAFDVSVGTGGFGLSAGFGSGIGLPINGLLYFDPWGIKPPQGSPIGQIVIGAPVFSWFGPGVVFTDTWNPINGPCPPPAPNLTVGFGITFGTVVYFDWMKVQLF